MPRQQKLTQEQAAAACAFAQRGLLIGQIKTEQRRVERGSNRHRLDLLTKQKRFLDYVDREFESRTCPVCGKNFQKAGDRKAHMKLQHWDANDEALGLPVKGSLAWAIMTNTLRK